MKNSWFTVACIFTILVLFIPFNIAKAQDTPPTGPIYIVQEGDYLEDIANRFHVSLAALADANGITNANQISIGQPLVIPGLEGIQGILITQVVQYGESLQSLSLRYKLSRHKLKQLNHITSPNELYAGYSLIVTENELPFSTGKRVSLNPGQSMLELAILNNADPWKMMADNSIENSWSVLPWEVLHLPGEDDGGPGALPPEITSVSITGLTQGKTVEILVAGETGINLSGSLIDQSLNFFPDAENGYTALQGVHAMQEPGLYPLTLQTSMKDVSLFSFSQLVMVHSGVFLTDNPLDVDLSTLDPETNRIENELWFTSSAEVSSEKLWSGNLYLPVDPAFIRCYSSKFGSRRSYNGSGYIYFHTGLDFCGQIGDPVYATAPGVVVFAGPLTVRGNAIMINHGRGVYSAYMHQSEILVEVGDQVEEGQLIGRVGNTGRVEGPHLHFEVLVGGVQVDPLDWLNGEYP